MRTCYVVPGILGSSLHTPDNPTYPDGALWPDPTRLALQEFVGLTLAADGVGPGPPFGEVCRAGGPLPDYYRLLTLTLAGALLSSGYQVRTWGYDWRKSIFTAGDLLAADIRNYATPDDPCSIVAHSQGGLVARCAWAVLVAAGESNLVRRIVTLGTPHRGSYAPVMVWSMDEELITQLALASNVLAAIDSGLGGTAAMPFVTRLELVRVTTTWPALYQLLPLVDSVSPLGDPLRPQLFDLANWPEDRQLSNRHLASAVGAWQEFLRAPSSMPPPEVLSTVGGSGRRTPFYLDDVSKLGSPEAIGFSEVGDSKVMLDSALVLPGTALVIASGHSELTLQPVLLERLPAMILADRGPPPPPAAADEQLSNGQSILAGPPFPSIQNSGTFRDCRDGTCFC